MASTNDETRRTERTREIIAHFTEAFYERLDVRRAFEDWVVADYIQHNPNLADGREEAIRYLSEKFAQSRVSFSVQRVLVDGDYGVIHARSIRPESRDAVLIDIYRVDGDRIVEHWDAIQEIPAHSANPHPMF